ncbi:aspartate kinase [Breznakibacter xylanolyticus]|uniref:Aspartokinase n=1 Tax=Breznakibacter xylanolyticus TaxID=990 RepID=A0A2W7NVL9_9BACT|nr:aspartate kinase [Breznakibacter xylanolyticus]PZX17346.1 aspartate kinase [Breznakibacter xylanolyticus]
MRVSKFGGTSVGSAQRMMEVAGIINDGVSKVVVLSAMSGTTNNLVEIASHLYKKDQQSAADVIARLEKKYITEVEALYSTPAYVQKGKDLIKSHFDYLKSFTIDMFTVYEEKVILAQGELISTAMFQYYLEEQGRSSVLLPALEFMRTDKHNEPDMTYIQENIARVMAPFKGVETFITQGYICRNAFGEIDNLQRGGSDYTASLIGAAINASEIQIWTDIDGMHNNDPRFVEGTKSISDLSFDEAAELAYFGAKILHPTCVLPAKDKNIPVRLLNTYEPQAHGTLISGNQIKNRIAAVAAKDGITAIKIKSSRMLMAYGFMRKVFEIFESYKTPIDMITTSEVGVSLTIDNDRNLPEIVEDLKKFGTVEVDTNQVIISVVGDLVADTKGNADKVFHALREVPIRMISYGGSNYNISLLINAEDKKVALNALSQGLF